MNDMVKTPSEAGFTLIEVLVALIVISIVGLMAWRGMDAMMRGQENIEGRVKQDAVYIQLIRQFERDCQEIMPSSTLDIPSYSVGEKNIWWVRRYEQANQIHWVIVGYGISANGLRRLISRPLANKTEILGLWQAVLRDPDLVSSNMKTSLEIPEIIYQEANATSNAPGQGSISAQLAGFNMRWGIKNITFPISRSCLAGTSL
ncbi:type II secretion system protein J [Polynucleobacter sp. JS-JIR-5-A7]|uniref:PulJ/GspJ family protein n=1 Tax=Polynucleobacter sp. JS-JIR-5-A7 TaxID=1758395 RepID=UPI001BFD2E28|nr:prepilin-type N-terminal cleavage/methylation domain-containing protein [Polynucleobacter sp. JS-JIR-5-A7]QWD39653.1 prepilin-type N-terminal cleavage/methylation domain-containing protein [Polynucleobacter paneuropaeus]QWE06221.1 prepilin-type N-terminal cleavage/methylation domain-containing protein [Polynucleobacter sp. JS-JIR-5-A7]